MELNKVWLIYWQSLIDLQELEVINIFSSFLKAENRVKELIGNQKYDYSCIDGLHEYKVYDVDDLENSYACYAISEEEVL